MATPNYFQLPEEIQQLARAVESKAKQPIEITETGHARFEAPHIGGTAGFRSGHPFITLKASLNDEDKKLVLSHETLHLYLDTRGYRSFFPATTTLAHHLNSLLSHYAFKLMGYGRYCLEKTDLAAALYDQLKSFNGPVVRENDLYILRCEWGAAFARVLLFCNGTPECNTLKNFFGASDTFSPAADIAARLTTLVRTSHLTKAAAHEMAMEIILKEIINKNRAPILAVKQPLFPPED